MGDHFRRSERIATAVLAIAVCGTAPAYAQTAGETCAATGPVDSRIAACAEVIEAKQTARRNRADAYYYRGNAYQTKGLYDAAIADYGQALRIDPNDTQAYYNRGIAYHRKGQYDLAIADYSRALRIDPKFAKAYNNRGIAYHRKGQYDLAIADYSRALRIDSNNAEVWYNRGKAYQRTGRYDQARADFEWALRVNPDHVLAKEALAQLMR